MVINLIKLAVISRGSHHDVDFSFLDALKLSYSIIPVRSSIKLRLFYIYFPVILFRNILVY